MPRGHWNLKQNKSNNFYPMDIVYNMKLIIKKLIYRPFGYKRGRYAYLYNKR